MRKPFKVWLALALTLCLLASVVPVYAEDPSDPSQPSVPDNSIPDSYGNPAITSGCSTLDAAMPLESGKKVMKTAPSAILYELNTDTLIYTYNPDRRIYPGGLAKIMTALIALDHGNLDETVTVTRTALDVLPLGTVVCDLVAGEQMSMLDLLYCVMVASANDAAVVVAEHISGSQEAFVELMNQKAQQLGCTDTHFANTTGLHDEMEFTTARDLGRMILAGLENEQFKTMFNAATYTVPATNKSAERVLNTTNYMMSKAVIRRYYDSRVTGGKTGASSTGRSLAVTAQSGNMNLLAIVLDAVPVVDANGVSLSYYGSFEEMKELLDYGCDNYRCYGLLYQDQAVHQFPVTGGQNSVAASPTTVLSVTLPKDVDTTEFLWRYTLTNGSLTAPVSRGQHIGMAQIWYRSICVGQTELVAMTAVPVKTDLSDPGLDPNRAGAFSLDGLLMVLGILAGSCLIFAGVLFLIRAVRIGAVVSLRRRRRMSRRRSR